MSGEDDPQHLTDFPKDRDPRLGVFRELEMQSEDPLIRLLAESTRAALGEADYDYFCIPNSVLVARYWLQSSSIPLRSVHFWFNTGHVVPAIFIEDSLYLVDSVGLRTRFVMEPGIAVLRRKDRHKVYGNRTIKQYFTDPLDISHLREIFGFTYPHGEVRSVEGMFRRRQR